MIENLANTRNGNSPEGPPAFHQTEDAIARISGIHEACISGRTACNPDAIMDILQHSELSRIESKLLSGDLLSLDGIQEVCTRMQEIKIADLDLDEEEKKFLHSNILLLSGRPIEIQTAVKKYTLSLLKFHQMNQRRIAIGDLASTEDFGKADQDRRRIHNALFDAISAYQTALGNINKLNIEWDFLPKGTIRDEDFFPKHFTEKENSMGREEVMLWAVATRLHKYFCDVREKAAQSETVA